MPALRLCRRRWHVGEDDFVIPAAISALLRVFWVVSSSLSLYQLQTNPYIGKCGNLFTIGSFHAQDPFAFVALVLALSSVSLTTQVFISYLSSRGTLLNSVPRRMLAHVLWSRAVIWLCEGVVAGLGITITFYSSTLSCAHLPSSQITALRGVSVTMAMSFLSTLFFVLCAFDCTGGYGSGKFSDQLKWRKEKFRRGTFSNYEWLWWRRLTCLGCGASAEAHAYEEVSRLFARYFENLDVVPSDIAAALVLINKQQHDMTQASFSPTPFPIRDTPLLTGTSRSHVMTGAAYAAPPGIPFQATNPHDMQVMRDIAYYSRYAIAAYGWPLYMYMHPILGCCQLCFSRPRVKADDDTCNCNATAVHLATSFREQTQILYENYENDYRLKPYLIVLDKTKQTIVVAIRGTLSLSDCFTDLMTHPIDTLLPLDQDPLYVPSQNTSETNANTDGAEQFRTHAHTGIWTAAQRVCNHIRQKKILENALAANPDYGLVITGHSLGAGVATLLTIMFRNIPVFQNARCIAYATPSVLNDEAARKTHDYIISVVLGKDVVPRLSHRSMRILREDMVQAVARSRVSKTHVICVGCCCCCVCKPKTATLMNQQPPSISKRVSHYDSVIKSHNEQDDADFVPFTIAGRVVHVFKTSPTASRMWFRNSSSAYKCVWADPEDFRHIIVSPAMLTQHMPDVMEVQLTQALSSLEHEQ